jgi:hypothetical protein
VAIERITVYYNRISGYFRPGGDIWQQTRAMGNYNERAAKAFAPKRTGALAASIKNFVTPVGAYSCRYTVRAHVDYAGYVSLGTTGPIVANNGRLLWVRPRPYSWYPWRPQFAGVAHGRTPRFAVEGQAPNFYLNRALVVSLRKLGAL